MGSPPEGSAPWRGRLAPLSTGGRSATSAVLVPLIDEGEQWSILLTARSRRLSEHPGELSFPGGRIERGDATAQAAALRETLEETGVAPKDVRLVGQMPVYTTFRGALVDPIVGEIPLRRLPVGPPRSPEVDEILLVPITGLLEAPGRAWSDPGRRSYAPQAAYTRAPVEHYSGRLMEEPLGPRLIHYWRLANGHTLWGITGDLVALFLSQCFGWRPPAAPRRIRLRGDVFPDAP